MPEQQNQVDFVERALLLKSLPVLGDASPDHLAAIVGRLVDRSFMPGAALFRAGEFPSELHLLFEGQVRLELPDGAVTRKSGAIVGLLDTLAQRPYTSSCFSHTAVHTLALPVDDLFDILEDFFDLARSLLGYLARHVNSDLEGGRPNGEVDYHGAPFVGRGQPIDLIDKIMFMKSVSLLAGASIEELARLGKEVAEVSYAAGDVVVRAGDRADAFYLVLGGRIGAHGPLGSVGVLDLLRQDVFAATEMAMEPSRALRVPAERFFDLLEDHFDLTLGLARRLSSAVRALPALG